MNLVIRAHSNKDETVPRPIVGHFDERGGTIGRSETNTLTLPDPNRHISRLQAEVVFNAGAFSIRNVGSANALLIGGRPVAAGESVALGHGDSLAIGSYVLRVSVDGASDTTQTGGHQASDPRSVIKASSTESRTNPRLRAQAAQPAVSAASRSAQRPADANPFFDLFAAASAARLPDDFDPFTDLPRPVSGRATPKSNDQSAAAAPDFSDLLGPGQGAASLDRAFNLDAPGAADPLAAFLAPPHASAAGKAASTDPFAMFADLESPESPPTTPTAFDHVPELQGAYAPPAVKAADKAAPRAGRAPPPAIVSVDLELPVAEESQEPAAQPATPTSAVAPSTSPEALWRAFCEGAGISAQQPQVLDAEFMRQLGQVLHHAVDGALKLIAARAAVKQELRADVTVIQSRHNNPLKFSPDAPAAIEQLLRAPLRGFMPGPLAMQDAMADLLGHAMGTMAGMRAALHGVLQRFEPTQLEHKLGAHKVMDALLPMNRRAKLWEQYLLHFERIRGDAQEDFHELFGKAFVEAYKEQLDKLNSDRRG
jgi:FHA domain-containing protein